ncbi:MAG: cytochrome P450 [Ktedonobacteraceae bacterium]
MSQTQDGTLSLADGLLPPYLDNPYALYRLMRANDPVYWDARANSWVLTRYADVATALRDARFSASDFMTGISWISAEMRPVLEPPIRALTRQMLFMDPPDHTRLRGLVARAFTPRMVETMRPAIQQIADELLDSAEPNGRMELIREYAFPLPAIVIATMLGVPPEDREQFNQWSEYFGALLDGSNLTQENAFLALYGVSEFLDYFRKIIRQRRITPKDDLLQAMINARDQGDALSEEELLGNCVLLMAAGHGTTMHLIGNGTLALLRNPQQRRRLEEQPELISSAVAEVLRYDSPVQLTSRRAKTDMQIGDKHIAEGQEVIMSLGAANYDPEQFSEPHRLLLNRAENRYLSFGLGIHFCLGAPLARIEGEIAFNTLLSRFPRLHLEHEEVEWEASMVFRGLKQLPVVFD